MRKKLPLKRTFFCTAALLICLEAPQLISDSTAVTSYIPSVLFENNLHTVVENRFYRSARMPYDKLEETIQDNNIRTVINLSRGGDQGQINGFTERSVVEDNGATYLEIPLNGKRLPSRDRLLPLLEAFETSALPILVHCSSGTHRSGLAAAIWLLEQEGADLSLAEEQLSPKFGFFRIERRLKTLLVGSQTIDQVLWDYQEQSGSSGFRFSSWALSSLAPYDSSDSLQNQCSDVPLDLLGLSDTEEFRSSLVTIYSHRFKTLQKSSYSLSLCREESRAI